MPIREEAWELKCSDFLSWCFWFGEREESLLYSDNFMFRYLMLEAVFRFLTVSMQPPEKSDLRKLLIIFVLSSIVFFIFLLADNSTRDEFKFTVWFNNWLFSCCFFGLPGIEATSYWILLKFFLLLILKFCRESKGILPWFSTFTISFMVLRKSMSLSSVSLRFFYLIRFLSCSLKADPPSESFFDNSPFRFLTEMYILFRRSISLW